MSIALGITSFLGFIACLIWLIVSAIQRKSKRNSLIGIGICAVLFIVGLSIPTAQDSVTAQSAPLQSSSKVNKAQKGASTSSNEVSSVDSTTNEEDEKVQADVDSGQSSESDGHITKEAYDKIKTGMSYDKVKKIIGSSGQNIFESGDKGTDNYSISYMWIGENGGEATIGFSGIDKLTVIMKSQSELK